MSSARERPPRNTGSITVALLLAAVAGQLDAIVYARHGQVFATAMTGNTVLLGIAALSRNGADLVHHAAPIIAFLLGVLAARLLEKAAPERAHAIALAFEAMTLAVAGVVASEMPQTPLVASIAFVSAVQVESFRRIGDISFSSTYVTGDLRDFAEALGDLYGPHADHASRADALARFRDLGLVWTCFLAGAVAGAVAAPHIGDHAFWIAVPLLAMAVARQLRMRPSTVETSGSPAPPL